MFARVSPYPPSRREWAFSETFFRHSAFSETRRPVACMALFSRDRILARVKLPSSHPLKRKANTAGMMEQCMDMMSGGSMMGGVLFVVVGVLLLVWLMGLAAIGGLG